MSVSRLVLCFIVFTFVDCQLLPPIHYYPPLPTINSCPPPIEYCVHEAECNTDNDCTGYNKCCETTCGGTVCTRPVTTRKNTDYVKPGYCPDPTDDTQNVPWVCSNRCRTDGDCRGRLKCCQSGCGGYGCTQPVSNPVYFEPVD